MCMLWRYWKEVEPPLNASEYNKKQTNRGGFNSKVITCSLIKPIQNSSVLAVTTKKSSYWENWWWCIQRPAKYCKYWLIKKKKPQGYGTMYFKNGSVFVGFFENGRANGPGHFIFPNGSYYHGKIVAGKANDING